MSAHPKIDPHDRRDDRLRLSGEGHLSNDIAVYTVNPQGHIVKEVWLKAPYLGIIHDIAITQKYVVIPVIARTTSLGAPEDWRTDVGMERRRCRPWSACCPRRRSQRRALVQGPRPQHAALLERGRRGDNKITMELPVSDEERSPSQIKRWTFNLEFEERRASPRKWSPISNGVLARMDDRLPLAAVSVRLRRQQRLSRSRTTRPRAATARRRRSRTRTGAST